MSIVPLPIPGFADLQVNGYRGVDFAAETLTERKCAEACEALLQSGTVVFLPTMVTSSVERYKRNLGLLAAMVEHADNAGRVPGIHLEGPFISPQDGAVGAHDARLVQAPDPALLDNLIEWSRCHVRLLTVAPERPGAIELIRHAVAAGVVVSVGHSLADAEVLHEATLAGACALTHFGNGIPASLPRHPNPLWAGLAQDRLAAMVIADGHHVPPEFVKVVATVKGADGIIVVSDSSPVAGLPAGTYETFGQSVVLERSGRLRMRDRDCLAGSSATMLQCMNHLASLGILTLDDMLAAGYHNPLKLIGADESSVPRRSQLLYDTTRRMFVCHGP